MTSMLENNPGVLFTDSNHWALGFSDATDAGTIFHGPLTPGLFIL